MEEQHTYPRLPGMSGITSLNRRSYRFRKGTKLSHAVPVLLCSYLRFTWNQIGLPSMTIDPCCRRSRAQAVVGAIGGPSENGLPDNGFRHSRRSRYFTLKLLSNLSVPFTIAGL